MDELYNKHYIAVDEQSRIVGGFSDAFRQPSETDICINEQGGYQFRLFPKGEENPALFEWGSMIPLYKWENGEVVRRTEEEIEADRAAIPEVEPVPTIDERVTDLETALAESDAVAMALYEANLEQETVNAEQDEAILGLYEMIGG